MADTNGIFLQSPDEESLDHILEQLKNVKSSVDAIKGSLEREIDKLEAVTTSEKSYSEAQPVYAVTGWLSVIHFC